MRILCRSDASVEIGTGHVVRCVTLAHALAAAGHDTTFVCRELQGNLATWVRAQGFETVKLPPRTGSACSEVEDAAECQNALSAWCCLGKCDGASCGSDPGHRRSRTPSPLRRAARSELRKSEARALSLWFARALRGSAWAPFCAAATGIRRAAVGLSAPLEEQSRMLAGLHGRKRPIQ